LSREALGFTPQPLRSMSLSANSKRFLRLISLSFAASFWAGAAVSYLV